MLGVKNMEIRQVVGLPKYTVSSTGVVFGVNGNPLTPYVDDKGYLRVYPYGVSHKRVHRLVAEAFLPKEEGKAEVNHIDGDKTNNDVGNLEWVDRFGNMRHAYETGLSPKLGKGENGLRAKLTQNQVDYIRSVYTPKHREYGQTALGKRFGVTNSCVFRIVHNMNWGG